MGVGSQDYTSIQDFAADFPQKVSLKVLFRPLVLDSLTCVQFESFEIRIHNVQDFRNFKL